MPLILSVLTVLEHTILTVMSVLILSCCLAVTFRASLTEKKLLTLILRKQTQTNLLQEHGSFQGCLLTGILHCLIHH